MLEHEEKDYLTGFFHKESLFKYMEKLLLDSNRWKKSFCIGIIDIDRFKKFNDKYGHFFGDMLLKYVSSTLRLSLQLDEHYIFRFGGDEFVVLLPDRSPSEAFKIMRRCNYVLDNRPFLSDNKLYRITISCGISCFPQDGQTTQELIEKADKAMYFSKHHGRNLTTRVDKIEYIKARNIIIITLSLCAVLIASFLGYTYLRDFIIPIKRRLTSIKIVTRSYNQDILVMKNGNVVKGEILGETDDKVVMNLSLDNNKAKAVFEKSKIEEIRYREKG